MIKKRVIPTLLFQNQRVVKGKQFSDFKTVGEVESSLRVYSAQEADEIMLLNIGSQAISDFKKIVEYAAKSARFPLSVGGGVKGISEISSLLEIGADKVTLNSAIYLNRGMIKKAVQEFGSQAIVAVVDYKVSAGSREVFINGGKVKTGLSLRDAIDLIQELDVGEIVLQCISREGEMCGLDLDVLEVLPSKITAPLVLSGGAGNMEHIYEALKNSIVAAVGCGSLFNFGDNNPIRIRSYLKNRGVDVRSVQRK